MDYFEKILAYWNVSSYLNTEQQESLRKTLNINLDQLERLWGKENEELFFLISYQSENVKNIFLFNESFAQLTKTNCPDGIITLQSGKSYLIEVKSSRKQSTPIGKGTIERQNEISKNFNLPLLYAVFSNDYWGLYSPEYIQSNNKSLTHPKDLLNSDLEEILNENYIIIPEGFKTHLTYSKTSQSLNMPFNDDFGGLIDFEVEFNKKKYRLNNNHFDMLVFAFTVINNALAGQSLPKQIDSEKTVVTSMATGNTIIPSYYILLAPILQTISNKTGEHFQISGFTKLLLEQFKNDRNKIFDGKKLSLDFIQGLINEGIPIKIVKKYIG